MVCAGGVLGSRNAGAAFVHLVVTSVKCYGQLKGRDGRMRKDTRQEANYNNPSRLWRSMNDGSVFLVVTRKSVAVSCSRGQVHSRHVLIRPCVARRVFARRTFAVIPT